MALEAFAEPEPLSFLSADARSGIGDNGKISYSIDEAAVQLLRGEPGWSSVLGQPYTVSYAYRAYAPAAMPSDTAGFQRFSEAQIDAAELALRAWSDVANIRFTRVGSGTSGEGAYSDFAAILFGNYRSGEEGSSAFSYFPGSTAATSAAGDVWVNASFSYNAAPSLGTYGAAVLLHEIGHAIGLEHPSDYNASADGTPNYAADADYYEDDRQYTVMSYFGEWNTGGEFGNTYPAAPMLDDIAAAQLAYGANMATRVGDTVYGFNATADRPWFVAASSASKLVFAVWDAGGTDTFDFSGYGQSQLIDLRAGYFSNVGGLAGNVTIAKGVVIEAAVGGYGADLIHGNAWANALQGASGGDTLAGGGGRDWLRGGDGGDSITGGADFDTVNGNKGADTIDGGAGGGDRLLGGQDNDRITAHAGNGMYNGNLGLDTVVGGVGADTVRGGQGGDVLYGGAGDDALFGDLGDDVLTGGSGADVFHVAVGGGIDRVLDFDAAAGDRIQLDGSPEYQLVQSGADAVVVLAGAGDQVILAGVQAASLPAGWILLA